MVHNLVIILEFSLLGEMGGVPPTHFSPPGKIPTVGLLPQNIKFLLVPSFTCSSQCSCFFNVSITFTIRNLLNKKRRVLQNLELWIFPAEIRIVYLVNQIWKILGKTNLLNDKKVCRIHLILLFDIFYWLCWFCIAYIENKYFIDPLYSS